MRKKNSPKPLEDESTITEISIAPDGRLYVFGASADVLEALAAVEQRGGEIDHRLGCLRRRKAEGLPNEEKCDPTQ